MLYKNAREAVLSKVGTITDVPNSVDQVEVRGMNTYEFLLKPFTISNPRQRFMFLKGRNGNPFAQVAETLWMLAGRDDLDWLEKYIPQCKKWSDDGSTWRAAYGPRLRKWEMNGQIWKENAEHTSGNWEDGYTDQIAEVVNKLKADPETRQAVISIWDPAQDWVEGSKDYPCNNWLHFIIRDGRLHLNVGVRSNDIIYGFSHVDFFCWSVLQELVAHWVGVDVGTMVWNATSFHLYERHLAMAQDISKQNSRTFNPYDALTQAKVSVPFDSIDEILYHVLRLPIGYQPKCEMLHVMQDMLKMYDYYLNNIATDDPETMQARVANVKNLAQYNSSMPHLDDMKIAAMEYFARKIRGYSGALNVSPQEYKVLRAIGVF